MEAKKEKVVKKKEPVVEAETTKVETPEPEIAVADMDVTSAQDWSKKNLDTRKLLLPSGAVFLVKNASLANLATKGIITAPLLKTFAAMKDDAAGKDKTETEMLESFGEDGMKDVDTLMRKFALIAVVAPKLTKSEGPTTDEISVNDLDFEDVADIFFNCMRGGAENYSEFFRDGK